MKNLLKQPLVIGSIIVLILAVIFWWIFAINPADNKIASVHQQQSVDQLQIQSLNQRLAFLKAEQNIVLKPAVKKFLNKTFPNAFPLHPYRPAIIYEIAFLAYANNLKLTTISDFTTGTWDGLVDIPISFTVSGLYNNEYAFLNDLYGYDKTFPRLITIQSLQISQQSSTTNGNSGSLINILNLNSTNKATMIITAYAYTNTGTVPPPPSSLPQLSGGKKVQKKIIQYFEKHNQF